MVNHLVVTIARPLIRFNYVLFYSSENKVGKNPNGNARPNRWAMVNSIIFFNISLV